MVVVGGQHTFTPIVLNAPQQVIFHVLKFSIISPFLFLICLSGNEKGSSESLGLFCFLCAVRFSMDRLRIGWDRPVLFLQISILI